MQWPLCHLWLCLPRQHAPLSLIDGLIFREQEARHRQTVCAF